MPIFIAILAIALVIGVVLLSKEASSPTEIDTDTTNEITRPENESVESNETSEENETPTGSETEIETNTEIEVNSENPTSVKPTPPTNSNGLSGTFTETAGYQTPAKTDLEVAVTLTLKDNIVTDADVVYDNSTSYSNQNQARFDQAYKTLVVGKNIDEISLSRVGGASLTSGAFNEAVAKISQKSS